MAILTGGAAASAGLSHIRAKPKIVESKTAMFFERKMQFSSRKLAKIIRIYPAGH